jgi:hypothetical protein
MSHTHALATFLADLQYEHNPEDGLARTELEAKFQRLLAFSGARPQEQGKAIIDKVWHLRDAQALAELI